MCGGGLTYPQKALKSINEALGMSEQLNKQAYTSLDPAGIKSGEGDVLHRAIGIGVKPETPDVIQDSPLEEERLSKEAGTRAASAKKRQGKIRAKNSLLSTGASDSSLIQQGRTTLG